MAAKLSFFGDYVGYYDTTAARLAEIQPAGQLFLDMGSGRLYFGDGMTAGGLPVESLNDRVESLGDSILAGYCTYYPGGLEIAAGVIFEIAAGAVAEVG